MNKAEILPYLFDASNVLGNAKNVFKPKTIEEIKNIVKNNESICIRGGGTGLAGGAVPNGDVVLDISKLNHIGSFDEKRKIIEVEAGVILDDLQDFLEKYNLEFPVRPSSHSVCTIGGMIATDAVGSRAIKYGRTSKWIRWIDIVNSKGIIERKGMTEISDFAGMEGITGIIVKACLNLNNIIQRSVDIVSMDSVDEICEFVKILKKKNDISMIEIINPFVSRGIGLDEKYNLIVEFEDNNKGHLFGKKYFELMQKRDDIYPFLAGQEFYRIEDPKITNDKIVMLLKWLDKNKIPYFGHISVGIIHPCFSNKDLHLIPNMMNMVKRIGGHVTGEHGIGILKKDFVDIQDKKILLNIKKRLDKKNKFNPGKIIDLE